MSWVLDSAYKLSFIILVYVEAAIACQAQIEIRTSASCDIEINAVEFDIVPCP